MRRLIASTVFFTLIAAGCIPNLGTNGHPYVTLIKKGPEKLLLSLTREEHVGIWGPEGYVGSRTVTYWARLEGSGPVFVNPHFQDFPPDFECKGVITLDTNQNTVKVEMRRIVSKAGEPERTKAHPINGVYKIDTVRNARPGE